MTKSISTIAPLAVIAASLVLASPAIAQSQSPSQAQRPGEQLGMRYLSWGGKPAGTINDGLRRASASTTSPAASGQVQPVSLAVPTASPTPTLTPTPARPNRYGSVSGAGLTPASAWIKPRAAPAQPYAPPAPELQAPQAPQAYAPQPQPQPISEPQPRPQAVAEAPHADPIRAVRQDPYSAAPPEIQMAMQPTPQPVPAPSATPAVAEAPADPMAPRRDALIFRMGGQAPAAPRQQDASPGTEAPRQLAQAAPARSDAPARQGARYYSVHREAGHQPDPMILPESVFIGGSADLAEPPPAPVVQRTVKGQAQVVVPNQDPSLP